jgi:hypothetical protein
MEPFTKALGDIYPRNDRRPQSRIQMKTVAAQLQTRAAAATPTSRFWEALTDFDSPARMRTTAAEIPQFFGDINEGGEYGMDKNV